MKTKYCSVVNCNREATSWEGLLIKSRDYVKRGVCDEHTGMPCPNLFNKKGVYGIYDKTLQLTN